LPIVVCLFNDRGYGVLRAIQNMRFEGRHTGVDLHTPDFVRVAEGMGVAAVRVSDADAFDAAFTRAMSADGPVLIDIDMTALAPMGSLFAPPRRV
jgi:acetolactate synthase-1/2/3 large subunit